jgi:hypothetical protein
MGRRKRDCFIMELYWRSGTSTCTDHQPDQLNVD